MAFSSVSALSPVLRRLAPLALTGLAALSLFAAPPAARADVKVVAVVDASGLETKRIRFIGGTIAQYYKGDKWRQEAVGRNIVRIYDGTKDRMYTLDRENLTYMVQTYAEATSDDSIARAANVSGRATISDGGNSHPIAGKGAKSYSLTALILVTLPAQGLTAPVAKIEGELWTGENLPFPTQNRNIHRLSYAFTLGGEKLWETYFEKTDSLKNIPLSRNLVITIYATKDGITENIDLHQEVKSVSTAKIPDYMFQVPKSYKLVDKVDTRVNKEDR